MGRVEDSTTHLSDLNTLYLSTIEALAMAIDAKDQITHGHIRRVQAYAVGLAHSLGVSDDRLLKAIEAAALLHDMGKLAIPEHILNKPGRLTAAEFERMKLHASIGADILSSITFPYPVVPIVRHHHENWDGTGYPDGLKGTDIPIGARILAVVDCFDALTSDRPYRPRLSDTDALAILSTRRSSMYDPMIVDAFFSLQKQMSLKPVIDPLPPRILSMPSQSALVSGLSPKKDAVQQSATKASTPSQSRPLSQELPVDPVMLSRYLKPLLPAAHAAVFTYEPSSDEIVVIHVVGGALEHTHGVRLQLGQGVSGWVAAARQTIANSDPVLDFGDMAGAIVPPLKSCLSTPLILNEQLLGVLTVYAETADAFSDEHVRLIEGRATDIARALDCVRTLGMLSEVDRLTGLPSVRGLETFLLARATTAEASPALLLFIDVVGTGSINEAFGRDAGDEVIKYVGSCAREVIRTPDMLFRSYEDEFVAVLENSDVHTGALVAQRIRERVKAGQVTFESYTHTAIDVSVTYSPTPKSGSRDLGLRSMHREDLASLRRPATQIVH
jgi:diguanylate cyclase (GGDEF)-like protein/putative nucleotidyltransferase with HDIG domain